MSRHATRRPPAGAIIVCTLAAMAIALGGNLAIGLLAATHDSAVTARTLGGAGLVVAASVTLVCLARIASGLRRSYRGLK